MLNILGSNGEEYFIRLCRSWNALIRNFRHVDDKNSVFSSVILHYKLSVLLNHLIGNKFGHQNESEENNRNFYKNITGNFPD